jgi:RNA polymerase sigma factor (sigma-70 family)
MKIRGAIIDAIRGSEFGHASVERDAIRIDEIESGVEFSLQAKADTSTPDPFVARAVEQLGGRQAAVMGLRYYAGLSQAETGIAIGISKHAVARAEAAAIQTLRTLLMPRAA